MMFQLLNRERKFDKFDIGDPDLQPVRSYESTTLVRVLFHLCVFVNSYVSCLSTIMLSMSSIDHK